MSRNHIESNADRDLHELRELLPSMRMYMADRDRIEKILGHLIEDRDQRKAVVDQLVRQNIEDILPITEKLENMMPTLEHIVKNKERIEWLWSVGYRYGGTGLAIIVAVSTFQEHAGKVWAFLRGLIWSAK